MPKDKDSGETGAYGVQDLRHNSWVGWRASWQNREHTTARTSGRNAAHTTDVAPAGAYRVLGVDQTGGIKQDAASSTTKGTAKMLAHEKGAVLNDTRPHTHTGTQKKALGKENIGHKRPRSCILTMLRSKSSKGVARAFASMASTDRGCVCETDEGLVISKR